jgi:hypothetical protein
MFGYSSSCQFSVRFYGLTNRGNLSAQAVILQARICFVVSTSCKQQSTFKPSVSDQVSPDTSLKRMTTGIVKIRTICGESRKLTLATALVN